MNFIAISRSEENLVYQVRDVRLTRDGIIGDYRVLLYGSGNKNLGGTSVDEAWLGDGSFPNAMYTFVTLAV